MKKFFNTVLHIKVNTCIIFTFTICIFLFINLFTDFYQISLALLWQDLLICFIGAIMQCIAYSKIIFKKSNFLVRSAIFTIPFLSFISLCAILFKWFPINKIGYWITFIIIFIIIFIFIGIGFSIYYKIIGTHYNEQLEQYQNAKKNK